MIYGLVQGQKLIIKHSVIASESVDYLTAHFDFSDDWAECKKVVHFNRGEEAWQIELNKENNITEDKHLNLTTGDWCVCVVGLAENGKTITTTSASIHVENTCIKGSEPFPITPPSLGEQILQTAEEAKKIAQSLADQKGKPNGLAPLGNDGKVPEEFLPPIGGGGGGGSDVVIDPTLTKPGQAADAKVTGDKVKQLSNFKADNALMVTVDRVTGKASKTAKEIYDAFKRGTGVYYHVEYTAEYGWLYEATEEEALFLVLTLSSSSYMVSTSTVDNAGVVDEDNYLYFPSVLVFTHDGILQDVLDSLKQHDSLLEEKKIDSPKIVGTKGQFLASDGVGGTVWETVIPKEEVTKEYVDSQDTKTLQSAKSYSDNQKNELNTQIEDVKTEVSTLKTSKLNISDITPATDNMTQQVGYDADTKKLVTKPSSGGGGGAVQICDVTLAGPAKRMVYDVGIDTSYAYVKMNVFIPKDGNGTGEFKLWLNGIPDQQGWKLTEDRNNIAVCGVTPTENAYVSTVLIQTNQWIKTVLGGVTRDELPPNPTGHIYRAYGIETWGAGSLPAGSRLRLWGVK